MKKLIIICLVFLGCEQSNPNEYTVKVSVKQWSSYEVEFPNLPKTPTNPLIVNKFHDGWDYDTTLTAIGEGITVRAKHLAPEDWIIVKLYENGTLVKADSAFGKVKEIWIEW